MKALLYATLACAVLAGCSYHETVVQKPVPATAAVVVPDQPPPPPPSTTVVVPED